MTIIATIPSRWAWAVVFASGASLVGGATAVTSESKKKRVIGAALLALGTVGFTHLATKGLTGAYRGWTVQRFTGSFDISQVDPNAVALHLVSCENLTDLNGLEAFSDLRIIYLRDCPITAESLAHVGKLKSLWVLKIESCPNITTLEHLTVGSQLSGLHLIDLSVTGEGLGTVQFAQHVHVTFTNCPNVDRAFLPHPPFHVSIDDHHHSH